MESYKSGFEPPGDVEFEDYGQAMKRTASETSLSNSKETKEKPGGKGKGKLWPFIKNKNKVTHECTHHVEHLILAALRDLLVLGGEGRGGEGWLSVADVQAYMCSATFNIFSVAYAFVSDSVSFFF